MIQIIKEVTVDVAKLNYFNAIVAKQYDRETRFLKVQLANNDEPIKVEAGSSAVINARRPDKAGKSFMGTVNSDGTVLLPIAYWMVELDGTVQCDVSIINGTQTLTTTLFEIKVEQAANGNDEITGDDDYGVLVELIQEVNAIKQVEVDRAKAESSRVTAEKNRATAETSRVSAEKDRASAETSRASAESTRVESENARVQHEQSRTSNETERLNRETARVDAENKRVSAETARNTAEETRKAEHEQAMADSKAAIANMQLVTAPLYIVNTDTHKNYVASLQVVDGKPVMIYEEKK